MSRSSHTPTEQDLHGKNYIGETVSAVGTPSFHGIDPSTGAKLEPAFTEATDTEVDEAMALAARAFERYRRTGLDQRAAFLTSIAERMERAAETIVQRASRESGLPEARMQGELRRTTGQLRLFAELLLEGSWVDARIDRANPDRTPLPKPDVRRMLVPLGPVVVFGASNFPLAFSVAGGDTASALAAGCPVVVKGHPAHPGTSELVARCVLEAAREHHLPDGIFSLLHGAGHEVGLQLVRHPATRAVGFTGSLRGGRALFDAAASREVPIPVFSEMGSTNPVFVLPGALRDRAEPLAEAFHASFTLGIGQFCTNPGLAVLADSERGRVFEDALAEKTRATPPGTMLYGGIRDAFEAGVSRLAQVPGVREIARGSTPADPAKTEACAAVFGVDGATFLERTELAEEVFGPSTVVVNADSREQLLEIARSLEGHLTATILGSDDEVADYGELLEILTDKVGRVIVNGFPTGVEVGAAMQHGGPYPATTDPRFTSVGTAAILRFVRPVAFQDVPQDLLPAELQDANPRGILRLVDNVYTREPITAEG